MKIGFNEGCDRFCPDHSVRKDLEFCEQYGFDCIDLQSECLDRDLRAGSCTLEELGAWFRSHRLKMLSYNALCGFNMKRTQAERDAVLAELDEIIRRCGILGCGMIVVVPAQNLPVAATVGEIREDAVAVLREMVKRTEPHGIRLSLEFCGAPGMSINRFEDAYAIVEAVDSPWLGLTLDQYHFHAMASQWESLERADGERIFIWHLNGMEDLPWRSGGLPGSPALCRHAQADRLPGGCVYHRGVPPRLLPTLPGGKCKKGRSGHRRPCGQILQRKRGSQ